MENEKRIVNFRDLVEWQKAVDLFVLAIFDVVRFSRTQACRIIADQLIRAIGSISANIAEGFGRRGKKEFGYHLGVAKGSAAESEDWYEKVGRLNFLDQKVVKQRLEMLNEIRKNVKQLDLQDF